MKDKHGTELKIGDFVLVDPLPDDSPKEFHRGYVRNFDANGSRARVDDGPVNLTNEQFLGSLAWGWSEWVKSERMKKLA